jgi:hypothetical protein
VGVVFAGGSAGFGACGVGCGGGAARKALMRGAVRDRSVFNEDGGFGGSGTLPPMLSLPPRGARRCLNSPPAWGQPRHHRRGLPPPAESRDVMPRRVSRADGRGARVVGLATMTGWSC